MERANIIHINSIRLLLACVLMLLLGFWLQSRDEIGTVQNFENATPDAQSYQMTADELLKA